MKTGECFLVLKKKKKAFAEFVKGDEGQGVVDAV